MHLLHTCMSPREMVELCCLRYTWHVAGLDKLSYLIDHNLHLLCFGLAPIVLTLCSFEPKFSSIINYHCKKDNIIYYYSWQLLRCSTIDNCTTDILTVE